MKKVSLYLLSILLLSNIAAYNQIQEQPSNYHDGGRVYVNKWIEVPLGYDQWGHPTPDTRKLLISVVGPKIIDQGTVGTFMIEVSPEYYQLPLSDDKSEYISSANISLITDAGSFEFGPTPIYKAIYGNNSTLESLTDLTDSWRNFYLASASILQNIATVVPYLGQALAATQAASSLLAWKKGSEPDWQEVWNNEFEKDIYPLPNPRHIVQQGFIRKYVYEVPFKYLTGQGDLFLQIDLVVIKHQYSDGGSFIYNFAFPLIQNEVTKKEVVPIFKKFNGNQALSIDGLGIFNFNYSLNIGLVGNNMTIKVSPENITNEFHFTKIELALQAKKGTVKLRSMPAIMDKHNNTLNFQSYKNIAGRIALRDMVNFGVSVYFFNTNTGTAISGTQAAFATSEGINNAFNSMSFSSSIDMQWKQQNNFDIFFMPQVKKDLRGKNIQKININLPLDFYTEDVSDSMKLNGVFTIKFDEDNNSQYYNNSQYLEIPFSIPFSTDDQIITSGNYGALNLAYDNSTNKLTGTYEDSSGWDEQTGRPRFFCKFYIEGEVIGKQFNVTTYYPTNKPDELIEWSIEIIDNSTLIITMSEDHGGCSNVRPFTYEPVKYELNGRRSCIQYRYVDTDRAYFYRDKTLGTKLNSYVIKGDFVCVDKIEGDFAYCTYYGKKTTSGWILIEKLNKEIETAPHKIESKTHTETNKQYRGCNDKQFLTDSRDGKKYKIVQIGNQYWMGENLNYYTGNSWCYDNNALNCDVYGRLYDWQTAINACPSGWHLPSTEEWEKLVNQLGGGYLAGRKMKSATYEDKSSNTCGFGCLMGGYYCLDCVKGPFLRLKENGYWWSSTSGGDAPEDAPTAQARARREAYHLSSGNRSSSGAWLLYLSNSTNEVERISGTTGFKTNGLSVRCLKN